MLANGATLAVLGRRVGSRRTVLPTGAADAVKLGSSRDILAARAFRTSVAAVGTVFVKMSRRAIGASVLPALGGVFARNAQFAVPLSHAVLISAGRAIRADCVVTLVVVILARGTRNAAVILAVRVAGVGSKRSRDAAGMHGGWALLTDALVAVVTRCGVAWSAGGCALEICFVV